MPLKQNFNRLSIDQEKEELNAQWKEYMKGLNKSNLNREMLVLHMQRMNNMDYRLIKLNRRDLLG